MPPRQRSQKQAAEATEDGQKKRRRGKRGGKRNRKDGADGAEAEAGDLPDADEPVTPAEVMAEEIVVAGDRRGSRRTGSRGGRTAEEAAPRLEGKEGRGGCRRAGGGCDRARSG